MRHAILCLVALVACKGKDKPPPPTVASAAPVVVDAAAAPPIDAAVVKLAITPNGIGPLQRLAWSMQTEEETAAIIQSALAPLLPGITTSFAVMDVPGEIEREEGYWAVKRGDKELVQVLRDPGVDKPNPAVMIVWSPDIPTADGTKVGDTVAAVLAKHPKLYCFNDPSEMIVQTVAADVTCHDKAEPGLLYVLDATKRKLARGVLDPAKISDIPVIGIVGIPR